MNNTRENKLNLKTIGIGLVIEILITAVTLFLFSVIMFWAEIDSNYSSPISSIGLAAGCFFGGFYCSKKAKNLGLLNGLTVSGIFFILLSIASLSVSADNFGILSAIHAAVMLLSGGIGGILGVNTKKRKLI